MSDNLITEQLPDKKELEKLSEKERKSFFRSIFKKAEEDGKKPADDGKEEKPDNTAVLEELKKDGRFAHLEKLLPRMEKLLAAFPELASIDIKERYQMAYFMIVGADATATQQKKPTPRQLVDALLGDPAAIKLYESIRTAEIAEKNGAYPAHSASKGAAYMPAAVKNAPKDLNEARKEAYGYFGINN
ncbi:MAG: hypothetical protein IJN63_09570 [Clostridia bacterium]|nr:hypothetical protein [Clostridia bacterium]